MKDWLASIKKGWLIYELSDSERVYAVFNAAVGTVLDFIGDHLVRDPCVTWKELEELQIGEYADEGTATETMKQLRDETPRELEKLATLAFPEEVRINAIMQAQLADLYVEVLQNEHIWHDIIK